MRTVTACSLLLALGLAACQSGPSAPAPDAAALPAAADDSCHARDHAALVGQDFKQAPIAPAGKVIRVVCSTCPMTMDFNAERLNVIYDADTGVVGKLTCG
jgi:hypothetical protein